ncbi:serine hydrolase domain-containing protein [Candidatus Eisenbacteria bacterium]|uniref:Serine hydrolase domain-containing protein n=1 Tax=Eiseniibacteriota bacterium TaxID=2212470 RepID=A0ABV6YN16_UNCEI
MISNKRHIPRIRLLLAVLLLSTSSAAFSQELPTTGLPDRLQAVLDNLVGGQETIRNGALLVEWPGFKWKGASGFAFADSLVPMLPDDQFNIDSIAKMMTATIVMKLVEAGQLGLDHRIGLYLPDSLMDGLHVYEGQSYGGEITIRQLLSHTSGFHDDWACLGFLDLIMEDPNRRWTPEETIEFVKQHCAPRFPPGEGFHYSDTGYNLLGLIIQQVTGGPLHEAYRKLLLDPLAMEHTYRPSHEKARPGIPGRMPSERYLDDIECTSWPAVMTADWGGGGLLSTTEDLNRFLRAFIENEIFEKTTTRDQMLTWVESGPFHNYGLGISRVQFDRSDKPEHQDLGEIWGHAGSSLNFMFYWPEEDIMIIGTLNQLNVERDRYDILATIMTAILGPE